MASNPSLAKAMGGGTGSSGDPGLNATLAMSALVLALLVAAYGVQAVGVLRGEETSGRLEVRLAGALTRRVWLSRQLVVVVAGTLLVAVAGTAAFAASAAWSLGHDVTGPTVRAVAAYLPASVALAVLSLLLFAAVPRWQPFVWLAYAVSALVAYLGDALGLADWAQRLTPFRLIGTPPTTTTAPGDVLLLLVLSAAGVVLGYLALERRGVPAA